MQALVLRALKAPLEIEQRGELEPEAEQVVVQLKAAALNRRDYWITLGMYPGIKTPVILGSDGTGVVLKLGRAVDPRWTQREVIINPSWDWGADESAQASNFRILGMPDDGTFASEVVVPAKYLHPKPEHLNWHEAAALPLAGLTAYRALFRQGALKSADKVLITGIGGGVASFALQFATAAGATVLVTSSKAEKIQKAEKLGAAAGFDYTSENWHKQLIAAYGPVDVIIDSAGGEGYARLIDVAAPGARIVNYGATAGPAKKLDLFKVFWKQLHLIGSTMGSPDDFRSMLGFVNQHQVKPVVDQVYPLSGANQAIERMRGSTQFGKIVLQSEA